MKDEADEVEEEFEEDPAVLHGYNTNDSQVTGKFNNKQFDKEINFRLN